MIKLGDKTIVILCIAILIILFIFIPQVFKKKGKRGYYICNDHLTGKICKDVLNKRDLYMNKSNWLIYIPCGYTKCEFEVNNVNISNPKQKIFMIDGCDNLASKFRLWYILKHVYGEKAKEIVPQSYLSNKKEDVTEFWNFYDEKMTRNKNSKFIFKNNKQRQEGISLLRERKDIEKLIKKDRYVIQEYLEDPFLISGRKVNLRYYILVICHPDRKEAYMHYNGFVYYTKEKYSDESIDFKNNITTGYIDRKIYEENPLTLQNFYDHLLNKGHDLNSYIKSVVSVFIKVFDATHTVFGVNPRLANNTRFQLFGCDIAPSKNLGAKLMEFNKGPDFSAKGPRDFAVKHKVYTDIMNLVLDKEKSPDNQFMKIWNRKND